MSAQTTIERGRTFAEARMTSRVTVRRKSSTETTQSPTTGREVPVWDVLYSNLKFRLGGSNDFRTIRVGAGVPEDIAVRTGHFPADTDNLRDGDLLEITSGECAGLVFRIDEATWKDQATARRVPLREVQRPTEWE